MSSIKHALIVDDSRSARVALRKLLEKRGISVALAESGEEALSMLKSTVPDVVFMDHMMPGMDGFATTQSIRANSSFDTVPVIMCTSKEEDDYATQAQAIGANAVLIKPAPPSKLDALIKYLENNPQSASSLKKSINTSASKRASAPTDSSNAVAQAMLASKAARQQNAPPNFAEPPPPPPPPAPPPQPAPVAAPAPAPAPTPAPAPPPAMAPSLSIAQVDNRIHEILSQSQSMVNGLVQKAIENSTDLKKIQTIVNKFANQRLNAEKETLKNDLDKMVKSFKSDVEDMNRSTLKSIEGKVPSMVDERMESAFKTQINMTIDARLQPMQQQIADMVRQSVKEDSEQSMRESLESEVRSIMHQEFEHFEKEIAQQFRQFEKHVDDKYSAENMMEELSEAIEGIAAEISLEIAEKQALMIAEQTTKSMIASFKNSRKAEMKDVVDERFVTKFDDFKFVIQKYSAFAAALGLTGALVFSVILKIVF